MSTYLAGTAAPGAYRGPIDLIWAHQEVVSALRTSSPVFATATSLITSVLALLSRSLIFSPSRVRLSDCRDLISQALLLDDVVVVEVPRLQDHADTKDDEDAPSISWRRRSRSGVVILKLLS
jgi:hypothetical protein